MRVLVDSTQLPLSRTGVGIYGECLIGQIPATLQAADQIFILVQSDDSRLRSLISAHPQLIPVVVPSALFRNRMALALYEQCILPWVLLRRRIDVIHSLHYTFPLLTPCPRVVTLHDMTYFLWPEMHTRTRRAIWRRCIRLALQNAEGILFVSDSTRRDAERLFGPGRNLRVVTPLAVDHAVFTNVPLEAIAEMRLRLGIERPYILFLGTVEPRKNVPRLVQAFNAIADRHPQHVLVIAGKLGWDYAASLDAIEHSPYKTRIRRLGYIAASDKTPLIAGCELLVYPSLYEGFGLPVLEGMAAGVPVITGNVSSLPEIAGDAALLVEPTSVEEIAEAMDSVLSDDSRRDRLRQAGKEQAKKFSWEKTAQLTCAAYRKLAEGRRG